MPHVFLAPSHLYLHRESYVWLKYNKKHSLKFVLWWWVEKGEIKMGVNIFPYTVILPFLLIHDEDLCWLCRCIWIYPLRKQLGELTNKWKWMLSTNVPSVLAGKQSQDIQQRRVLSVTAQAWWVIPVTT